MHQIIISDITIDVVRKEIKNLHLSVNPPDGKVKISSPLRIDDEVLRLFAVSKLSWIRKQKKKFKSQVRQSSREFLSRESHYFLGKRYLLNVIEHNAPPKVVLRSKTYIDLYLRNGSTQFQKGKILNDWYRSELKKHIPLLINTWQQKIGVTVNDWGVKQMKTKWGSCNIKAKRIWINLELAKKPFQCLEYIIVHEMVHLLERHHNERFITYMNKFIPQWRSHRDELNQFPISHSNWSY